VRRSTLCLAGSTHVCCSRHRAAGTSILRRSRDWYPALEAAGIEARGRYCLRHIFATEALATGISTFELARLMGTSIRMIERTYGHYARDTEERIRARLDARSRQMGAGWASGEESS